MSASVLGLGRRIMAVGRITMANGLAVAQTMAKMGLVVGQTMANMGLAEGPNSLALGPNSLALGLTTLALGPTTILSMGQARDQVQDAFVQAAIHVKDQHQVLFNTSQIIFSLQKVVKFVNPF